MKRKNNGRKNDVSEKRARNAVRAVTTADSTEMPIKQVIPQMMQESRKRDLSLLLHPNQVQIYKLNLKMSRSL